MSNVLEFRVPHDRPRASSAESAPHGSATIVLFTGVRYERAADQGDPTPGPAASTGRGRKSRAQK